MSAAVQLPAIGSCWYRNQNEGAFRARQAADRYINDLACGRELGPDGRPLRRRAIDFLRAILRALDGQGTTQKTLAWVAERMPASERTAQRALRDLAPQRKKHPELWGRRIINVKEVHHRREATKKNEWNAPHWLTILVPARYWTGRPPERLLKLVTGPASAPFEAHPVIAGSGRGDQKRLSGGGDKTSPKQIDPGSGSLLLPETFHPSGSLSTPRAKAAPEPPAPSSPPRPIQAASPTPTPAPIGCGDLPTGPPEPIVQRVRDLFPSHAGVAHRAVAKLRALGWSDDVIASYLKSASRDPSLQPGKADHPLSAAVWRAEKELRKPPTPPRPPREPIPPPRYSEPAKSEKEKALIKLSAEGGARLLAALAEKRGRVVLGPLAPADGDGAESDTVKSAGGPEEKPLERGEDVRGSGKEPEK
jgi:hypothetical protein